MIATFSGLLQEILARPGPVRLVAVDGPGGSGKSTFARRLAAVSPHEVSVVHTDDFASPEEPIDWWPSCLSRALEPLAAGRPARFRRYDWEHLGWKEEITVDPRPVVIIEGVSSGRREWADRLAMTIWIHADRDLRLSRGLERDGEHMAGVWSAWMAAEEEHYSRDPTRPRADLVVDGNPDVPHHPETQFVVLGS
ncbi:MAG TPA: aminodeoxychorismate synthase [Acidimicrobiales bacterium]|nr:aminodeoxychorismate synthase [Acidimicrobiales bacterium]